MPGAGSERHAVSKRCLEINDGPTESAFGRALRGEHWGRVLKSTACAVSAERHAASPARVRASWVEGRPCKTQDGLPGSPAFCRHESRPRDRTCAIHRKAHGLPVAHGMLQRHRADARSTHPPRTRTPCVGDGRFRRVLIRVATRQPTRCIHRQGHAPLAGRAAPHREALRGARLESRVGPRARAHRDRDGDGDRDSVFVAWCGRRSSTPPALVLPVASGDSARLLRPHPAGQAMVYSPVRNLALEAHSRGRPAEAPRRRSMKGHPEWSSCA